MNNELVFKLIKDGKNALQTSYKSIISNSQQIDDNELNKFLEIGFIIVASITDQILIDEGHLVKGISVNYYSNYSHFIEGKRFGITSENENLVKTFVFKKPNNFISDLVNNNQHSYQSLKNIVQNALDYNHPYVKLLDIFYSLDDKLKEKNIKMFSMMKYFRHQKNENSIISFERDNGGIKLTNGIIKYIWDYNDLKHTLTIQDDNQYDYESYFDYLDIAINKGKNLTKKSSYKDFWNEQLYSIDNWIKEPISYNQYSISISDLITRESKGNIVIFTDKNVLKETIEKIKFINDIIFSSLSEQEYEVVTKKKMKEISLLHQRSAITSILVDSFAHNVSAHALSALEWWFRKRSSQIDEAYKNWAVVANIETIIQENIPEKAAELIGEKYREFHAAKVEFTETDLAYLQNYIQNINTNTVSDKFPVSFNHVLWPLLRFLRDKAVFWSGVTRDIDTGGEIMSWQEILWDNFANNPLYLGTIAKSEGITTLEIKLKIFDKNKIPLAEGVWVTIDLSDIDKKDLSPLLPGIQLNQYITLGPNFKRCAELLKEEDYQVFLPNGKVGLHALMTLIENTLRNIKHHPIYLEKNTTKKIELQMSICPIQLMGEGTDYQLFKFSTRLHHKIEPKENKLPLFEYLFEELLKPIVNADGVPRLGGNSQDKICAAMLLNNTFSEVEELDAGKDKEIRTQRNVFYYPWVGFSIRNNPQNPEGNFKFKPENNFPIEGGVSAITVANFKKAEMEKQVATYRQKYTEEDIKNGYLIKSFHLWKGEIVKTGEANAADNPSRFKFVKEGDFRNQVVRKVSVDTSDICALYQDWLMRWLKPNTEIQLEFWENESRELKKVVLTFAKEKGALWEKQADIKPNVKPTKLYFSHNSKGGSTPNALRLINIRSHARFAAYFKLGLEEGFFKNIDEPYKPEFLYELLEVINTKILVVDNRAYQRASFINHKNINLTFIPEKKEDWDFLKADIKSNYHICVIHLTFIESLKYGENEIPRFIQEQLFNNVAEDVPDNFYLVITSGRGRTDWMKGIRTIAGNSHYDFVTYKPIEAILGAIEDGVIIHDDYQTKYNVVKLFLK